MGEKHERPLRRQFASGTRPGLSLNWLRKALEKERGDFMEPILDHTEDYSPRELADWQRHKSEMLRKQGGLPRSTPDIDSS